MSRRRTLAVAATLVVGVVGPAAAGLASWYAAAPTSVQGVVDALGPGRTPQVVAVGRTVTLSWAPSSLTESGRVADGYVVRRLPEGGGEGAVVDCRALVALTSCTEAAVPTGSWRYTVQPTLHAWTGAESDPSDPVTVGGAAVRTAAQPTLNAADRTIDQLSIEGFAAELSVDLVLVDAAAPDGPAVGDAVASLTTDASGRAGPVDAAIPDEVPDGTYVVVAVVGGERAAASAPLVLDTVAPAVTAGAVPTWSPRAVTVRLDAVDPAPGAVASIATRVGDAETVVHPGDHVDLEVPATATVTYSATDVAGNVGETHTVEVRIDAVAPVATPPAIPTDVVNTVVITSAPSDADSGVVAVRYRSCAGTDCTPTTLVGEATVAPFAVRWARMPAGPYRVLAEVVDGAGNVATSAAVDVSVTVVADTVGPLGQLLPLTATGTASIVGRTVPLAAQATDESGIGEVRFEVAGADGVWRAVEAPVTVVGDEHRTVWDAGSSTPGRYRVRALATDGLGNVSTFPEREALLYGASAVQLVNGGGAAGAGRLAQGDVIRVSFNALPRRTALCAGGWNTGFITLAGVVVTITDGGPDQPDRLAWTVPVCRNGGGAFGTLTLGSGAYVGPDGATLGASTGTGAGRITFEAATNTLVITVGALQTGTVEPVTTATTAIYTPSPEAVAANLSVPAGTATFTGVAF